MALDTHSVATEEDVDRHARLQSLVSALQLSDSAFPSGRYTLSHGLEPLSQERFVTPAAPELLAELLVATIRLGVAPSDGLALVCAHRTVSSDGSIDFGSLARVDARLTAVKLAKEPREASQRTGRAVLATAVTTVGSPALLSFSDRVRMGVTEGNHAVVVGVLSAVLGVPCEEAVVADLYAFASGWVAAAIRLGLADHRTAQAIVHHSRSAITTAGIEQLGRDVSEISSCTPLLDLMAMRHEEAEIRLFAT